jgi:hypothetical protein
MATMHTEVYDAFRRMGAKDEDARSAAEALSQSDRDLSDLKHSVDLLKWMVGVNTALVVVVLGKLLLMH